MVNYSTGLAVGLSARNSLSKNVTLEDGLMVIGMVIVLIMLFFICACIHDNLYLKWKYRRDKK